jgi:hypothetical protein
MAAAPLVSCDNQIFDYEEDCSVTYQVKFKYDMNMKYADAFAHEVTSVNLYAFDPETGSLVYHLWLDMDVLGDGDPGDFLSSVSP